MTIISGALGDGVDISLTGMGGAESLSERDVLGGGAQRVQQIRAQPFWNVRDLRLY